MNLSSQTSIQPVVSSSMILGRYLFSLILALVLTLTPWVDLRPESFPDVYNYIARYENISAYGIGDEIRLNSIVSYFTQEVLWVYLMYFSVQLGLSAENFLALVAFISSFIVFGYICRNTNVLIAFLFCFNPFMIDFFIAQGRSALAFSFFVVLIQYRNYLIKSTFGFASFLIHTSSIVNLAFIGFEKLSPGWLKKTILIISPLIVVILKDVILYFLGDRRAASVDLVQSKSWLYAAIWIGLLIWFALNLKFREDLPFLYSLYMLSFFFYSNALGDYSARFLVYAFPFVIHAIFLGKSFNRSVLFSLLFLYQTFQFYYWI